MSSWQIGDVKVTRVVESTICVSHDGATAFMPDVTGASLRTIPWLYPDFVSEQDEMLISIHALLVETPDIRLVVDTCIGSDRDAPDAAAFLRSFAETGCARQDVDFVICTHLHFDHVGWNTLVEDGRLLPTFPNARYLFAKQEFDYWRKTGDDSAILMTSIAPIIDANLAEMVDCDHRISPEICLIPTAGHTPGHVSILIRSADELAIITGDMVHHPCQIARPDWCTSFDVDRAVAAETRWAQFASWADQPILIIGTHFAGPTAGHILRAEEAFRFVGFHPAPAPASPA